MAGRRRFGRVRQVESGRWQARYSTPDGCEHTGPQTFATKTEASRFLSHVEADIDRGVWLDHRLGQVKALRQWAKRYMATTTHLKPKTRESYASLLRSTILPSLGDIQVAQLRTITVQEWISKLTARGLSSSRIRQSYRLLSQIMAAAEDSALIATSPCRRVRLPRMPESHPRILSHGHVAAIVLPHPNLTICCWKSLRTQGFASAKRSRCAARRWMCSVVAWLSPSLPDVNGHLTSETPKSHQQRSVSMPDFLAARLREHLDARVEATRDALLFVGATGQPLRYSSFLRRVWRPALEAAALVDVTPHDLRATHASWVIDEGGSVMDAAARLGHAAGTVTTRHYARPVDGRDAEIAARLNQSAGTTESDRARGGHVILNAQRRLAP